MSGPWYFTGMPCLRGHVADRHVKNRECRQCRYDRTASWRKRNAERHRAKAKEWRLNNPEHNKSLGRRKQSARRARLLQAMPSWVNRDELNQVYDNCPPGMHVDHIYPLRGKNSCGLHVPWNLQYLTGPENISKGNKEPGLD